MPGPSRRCSAGKSSMLSGDGPSDDGRRPDRRTLILTGAAALVAGQARANTFPTTTSSAVLDGKLQQSGFAFGRTAPRAELAVDGVPVGQASKNGLFVIGFDRDSPPEANHRPSDEKARVPIRGPCLLTTAR